jgi:hypothetical protein
MNDYCLHRLLIVGAVSKLKAFDRSAMMPKATDFELLERTSTRRVWQFVTEAPALKFLRVLSRRWPDLTFVLYFDCEDGRFVGLARATKGRLRRNCFQY